MNTRVKNCEKIIFGIPISTLTRVETVNEVILAAKKMIPMSVAFAPVHSVMVAQEDHKHKEALCSFDIVAPDGQPIRWALNYFHKTGLTERVYGPDVTLDVCEQAEIGNLSVFFYGSTNKVLDQLKINLKQLFPDLRIVGLYSPPFGQRTKKEVSDDVRRIKKSEPDILFVGLGCPKQEQFMHQNIHLLGIPTLGVGAAFDFHAGILEQAPSWMQRNGLEWGYRLAKEPRRLFRRYFYYNNLFLWLAIKEAFRKKL